MGNQMRNDERRGFQESLKRAHARVNRHLSESTILSISVAALLSAVFEVFLQGPWWVVPGLGAVVLGGAFAYNYFEASNGRRRWTLDGLIALRRALAFLAQAGFIILLAMAVVALGVSITSALWPEDPTPAPTNGPPPSPTFAPPSPTPTDPAEETSRPRPVSTRPGGARPTSQKLLEVSMTRRDLRGVIQEIFEMNELDYAAVEPWDYSKVRLCPGTTFEAPVTTAWKNTRRYADGDDAESAAASAATFYDEDDAAEWITAVLDHIGQCNIEEGPRRPHVGETDETFRFRQRINPYGTWLNIDRVLVRVDNVVLQVVVARYDGDNQAVADAVAARVVARLVALMDEIRSGG